MITKLEENFFLARVSKYQIPALEPSKEIFRFFHLKFSLHNLVFLDIKEPERALTTEGSF